MIQTATPTSSRESKMRDKYGKNAHNREPTTVTRPEIKIARFLLSTWPILEAYAEPTRAPRRIAAVKIPCSILELARDENESSIAGKAPAITPIVVRNFESYHDC